MSILIVLFGLLSDCLLSVLVGIIGSSRRIGFGLAFLVSLIFPPLVGLIITLLADLLNRRITPVVPRHGSVGASGDLVQLAHIALALIGEGEVFVERDGVPMF